MTTSAKDLTQEPPASPHERVGGYVILARLADKARAEFLGGEVGEYHTDCPLDNMLLNWKGVPYSDVKKLIVDGSDDEQIASFLDSHGTTKSAEEIKDWSDTMSKVNPYFDPEKKDWYKGEVEKVGLDPASTPLFDWLDATDKEL